MTRAVDFAHWLFDRSRVVRTAFVLCTWPAVYITDRWQRISPRARLRDGLSWAWRGDYDLLTTSTEEAPHA